MEFKKLLVLVMLAAGNLALHIPRSSDSGIEERIHRITHADGVDGYDLAHLYFPETKRDDDPSHEQRSLELHLNSGERLRMSLRKRSVVSPDTLVTEVFGDREETRRLGERDCYFSGPTEGTSGHASLAMCDGRLMGSVMTEKRHYELHALPEDSTANRRSTDPLRVLVTWTEVGNVTGQETGDVKRWASEDGIENTEVEDSDEDEGLWDDVVEIPEKEEDDERRYAVKRSLEDRKVVVEILNYLDHWYLQKVQHNLGLNTTDELVDLQVLKWSGVQAVLGDEPTVTWDIKLKLDKIEIWRTDPSWYVTDPNNTIGARLSKVCHGSRNLGHYDQVTLSTGYTSDGGRIGLTYIKGVCRPRWHCAAVITANLKHGTELHEFGHSLGLNHDGIMGCPSNASHGFMGGNDIYFRSDCYTPKFNEVFPQKGCLFTDQYASSTSAPLKPLLPGQTIGVEDQCRAEHGAGFEYLRIGDGDTMCANFGCMCTDASSIHYGTVYINKALEGTPCGHNKICRHSVCDNLDSALISEDETEVEPLLKDGGWGSFGALSGCSSSCGPAIRIARRYCNYPRYDKKRFYLLPDGTPCSGTDTTAADNSHRGISWHCVKGRCMAFGCNGKTLGPGGGIELSDSGAHVCAPETGIIG
ncbi:hypothetical protein BaRGS_00006968 [Batillaria attramentaria]|uniref:Peptidase M12B domain-containing protein n=1 Tax=Batillaria attramentaria TaxID=370345 RepID=A0ABD0LS73_9CAEN